MLLPLSWKKDWKKASSAWQRPRLGCCYWGQRLLVSCLILAFNFLAVRLQMLSAHECVGTSQLLLAEDEFLPSMRFWDGLPF
jgi:hypothetical protein